MFIGIVNQRNTDVHSGNRVTADRWGLIFEKLDHSFVINPSSNELPNCDLLIGIHAAKSAESILEFKRLNPRKPAVIALSGTDIYQIGLKDESVENVLSVVDAIVNLEPKSQKRLSCKLQSKSHIIRQSAEPTRLADPQSDQWEVTICGHLRDEKNPFLCIRALNYLHTDSELRFKHIGRALTEDYARQAKKFDVTLSRYSWLGELDHAMARKIVASSQLAINTSVVESSANAVIEAIVDGVPVIATNIDGNTGVLGDDYDGLFESGDAQELARLLAQFEQDQLFRTQLSNQCREISKNHRFSEEKKSWEQLLHRLYSKQ